mmetsp:Transcript_145251/g.253506  ORF Transcript_145251/g.253506 Transcript_145251/m.253506 type:complete len:489 (-) Transcript_145251:84-1550(-)
MPRSTFSAAIGGVPMDMAAAKKQGRLEGLGASILEEHTHLNSLPNVVLQLILDALLPQPVTLDTPAAMWHPVLCLLSAGSSRARDAWGESLCLALPALGASGSSLSKSWATSLLAALKGGGRGGWQKMSTMRSIRTRTQCSSPLQSSPKLSGASLCAVGNNCLVLFGGRCSISGETLGETYVVRIPVRSSGLAHWEKLTCNPNPPARCYHSALRGSKNCSMFVFGGASNAGVLLGDAWWFEVKMVPAGPQGCLSSCGQWHRFKNTTSSESPSVRSSHVCVPWSRDGHAVLHGGLGEGGTKSDTWILKPEDSWVPLQTTGPRIARAHHCGGVVGDNLLIYSGQNENFLTVKNLCMLQLSTAVWQEVVLSQGPSARIDAAAAAVDSIGLLVFGGVGVDFEFESPVPWLVPAASSDNAMPQMMAPRLGAPCPRACSSMCMDGLHAYVFGGFDGQQDLGDLWCLHLAPNCFQQEELGASRLHFMLPESVKGF